MRMDDSLICWPNADGEWRVIAALDAMDGDCDGEPWLAGFNPEALDDREGGDVLDEGEPHDGDDEANGDDEPSMGWSHPGQGGVPIGWGYHPLIGAGMDNDE